MSAETEVLGEGIVDVHLLGFVECVVEVHLAVGFLRAGSYVNVAVLDTLDAGDELNSACTSEKVSDHGLCGVDLNLVGIVTHGEFDGSCLEKVIMVS